MTTAKVYTFDPEELRKLGEKLSYNQIAKIHNCSTTTIRKAFIELDIEKNDLRCREEVISS